MPESRHARRPRPGGAAAGARKGRAKLLACLPAVAWERDARTGDFTYVNEHAERLLGFPAPAWTAPGFWDAHVHADDRDAVGALLRRAAEGGAVCDVEYRMLAADGRTIWVRDIATVAVSHGMPTRLYGVLLDVTARRLAEEALASQQERLRRQNLALLALATRDASGGGDFHAVLRALTEAAAHAMAVARVSVWKFVPGAIRCLDLYCTDARTHEHGLTLPVTEYPRYFDAVVEARALCAEDARRDPRTRELSDAYLERFGITSMLDAPVRVNGAVVGVLCLEHVGEPRRFTSDEQQFAASMADLVALAVTTRDRRLAEDALRRSEARTKAIVQASPDAILVLDPTGRVVEFNHAAEGLFGRVRDAVLGREAVELFDSPHERERVRAILREHLDADVPCERPFEAAALGPHGDTLPVEVRACAFPGEGGNLLAAFVRDLSRPEAARRALRAEYERLDRLVEDRAAPFRAALLEAESFSSMAAHDLRGPIRAIDAFSRLLEDETADVLTPTAARYLARIRASVARMNALVSDLLLLSRVSAVTLERRPVDLGAMAAEIAEELAASDPERRVTFSITRPVVASCDPRLTRVALENLFSNAWKFTSRHATARIAFEVHRDGERVVYSVTDDGAGFEPAAAARLFEPFRRLHTVEQFEGTGMGLATVRRIVERHGGRVWAEGAVEKGARVCFTLPDLGPDAD